MKIPFSPPDIREEDIARVAEVLRSGWITTGPVTKEFERSIADYCGTPRAVCLNSATAALEGVLRVLGIGPGDEVITSAYTYTASASVICHVGAKPVLVDTAPDSFEMDYDALPGAITERTKAMIPVDIAGLPCDYARMEATAEGARGLFRPNTDSQAALGRVAIVADAAHSFGAAGSGRLADFSCFSFHAVKNLTTSEGGAITWRAFDGFDNDALYKRFMLYALHGQDRDALAKLRPGAWEYDIAAPLYKCNMTDIAAALGQSQLARYREILARRRALVRLYDDALRVLPVILPTHGEASSAHLYLLRIAGADEGLRNRVITRMAERGVACNVHYKPLPLLTAYRNMGFDIADYPNAYAQYANEISLPLYTRMTDEEVLYVAESLADFLCAEGVLC